jgi:hypothetical protein
MLHEDLIFSGKHPQRVLGRGRLGYTIEEAHISPSGSR